MKHLAQLAGLYVFLDPVDAVVEPVDDADVENLSRFMLHPLHLQGFLIGAGGGLFTQHMLAMIQHTYGLAAVGTVGACYVDRVHIAVIAQFLQGCIDLVRSVRPCKLPAFFHGP